MKKQGLSYHEILAVVAQQWKDMPAEEKKVSPGERVGMGAGETYQAIARER